MDDYVRAVVAETIKEWDFRKSLQYLSIYQDNDVIRGLLIENCEKKSKKAFTNMIDDIEELYKNLIESFISDDDSDDEMNHMYKGTPEYEEFLKMTGDNY